MLYTFTEAEDSDSIKALTDFLARTYPYKFNILICYHMLNVVKLTFKVQTKLSQLHVNLLLFVYH